MLGAAPGADLSSLLRAAAPFIKFLDTALGRLPDSFVHQGRVQRGVKCARIAYRAYMLPPAEHTLPPTSPLIPWTRSDRVVP